MSPEIGAVVTAKSPRRLILAFVLIIIALSLIGGGAYLLSLGGSSYYLLAGLAVGASAYFAARGSERAIVFYLVMLLATLVWALFESRNVWGVQARVAAPLVLGIWVARPWLRRLSARVLAGVLAAPVLVIAVLLYLANSDRGSVLQDAVPASGSGEWRHYGNDQAGTRFSPLTKINQGNVGKLERAWTYRTGDPINGNGFQATPLMIGDTLYLCTSTNQIHALDPETGRRRWIFDPKINTPPISAACRGVTYFEVRGQDGHCAKRIVFGTVDARLMAVDAKTGALCAGFGRNGSVNLLEGMGKVLKDYYYVSSPPALVQGKLIVGGNVMDGQRTLEPSGVVRAYDATTGEFAWAWDMDHPDQHGQPAEGESYSRGTANSWAPMSGDDELGLVYVPTGNATPDYWGAHRSQGSEKYSSSLVAIDVDTGEARWHFQTVHHDLWDYDVASQPTLFTLPVNGKPIPALVQPTKRGEVFMLDRRTGKPLATVEEKPVPGKAMKGDWVSPTQPFSTGMPGFGREHLTEAMMWGATPLDQLWCRIKFKQARYDGAFTPPSMDWNVTYPGFVGGMNWGGVSVDPERRLMVVNWLRMPNYTKLISRSEADRRGIFPSEGGAVPHVGVANSQAGTPYASLTSPFMSPLAIPCMEPPLGKIAVVDLLTRKIVWEKPLGTSYDSGPLGAASRLPLPMGVPTYGGSLITRGGVIFIGGSHERRFRALDIRNGQQLWSRRLPSGGNATPMTYISSRSGRQFVVIVAGGSGVMGSGNTDHVEAYAIPAN